MAKHIGINDDVEGSWPRLFAKDFTKLILVVWLSHENMSPTQTATHCAGEVHNLTPALFLYEGAFMAGWYLHKHSEQRAFMTAKDEKNTDSDENNGFNDIDVEDMAQFLVGLNRFVLDVATMDWPDGFPLDKNEKFCYSVFLRYWRTQNRKRRANESSGHEFHMRFEGNKEEIRRFMQHRFGEMFSEGEPSLDIDPGHHEPDEEHVGDDAKERQKRFQDEWE